MIAASEAELKLILSSSFSEQLSQYCATINSINGNKQTHSWMMMIAINKNQPCVVSSNNSILIGKFSVRPWFQSRIMHHDGNQHAWWWRRQHRFPEFIRLIFQAQQALFYRQAEHTWRRRPDFNFCLLFNNQQASVRAAASRQVSPVPKQPYMYIIMPYICQITPTGWMRHCPLLNANGTTTQNEHANKPCCLSGLMSASWLLSEAM